MKKNQILILIFEVLFLSIILLIICFPSSNTLINFLAIIGTIFSLTTDIYNKIYFLCTKKRWKYTLRRLQSDHYISKNELIRISFSYLFRIEIDGNYLLVLNNRGTYKFQPVGGVYQYSEDENKYFSANFSLSFDTYIKRDKDSEFDYRLQIPSSELVAFVKRFESYQARRERVNDLRREFVEELINTEILPRKEFSKITYRYCGRQFEDIIFSRFYGLYELLMADIVELKCTDDQKEILRKMSCSNSTSYGFYNENVINNCGISIGTNYQFEKIGDHTKKILKGNDINLEKNNDVGEYTIYLD